MTIKTKLPIYTSLTVLGSILIVTIYSIATFRTQTINSIALYKEEQVNIIKRVLRDNVENS